MKVLFLFNAWVHDGPGVLFRHLLPRLAARPALTIEAAALKGRGGPLRDDLEAAGVACRDLEKRSLRDPWGIKAVRRLLIEGEFDILAASLPRPEMVGSLAARDLRSVEAVSVDHGAHAWREKGWLGRAAKRLRGRTLKRIRTVVCVSESVRWELFRSGIQGEKLRIIHNGVDAAVFRPPQAGEREAARREFGLPGDALVIGCAGSARSSPDSRGCVKGQDLLLEAFAKLLQEEALPQAVRDKLILAFAGGGPMEATLRHQAEPLGEKVRFLGALKAEAMPRFYGALDIAAQPSRLESFGLAAAEAMASGLPLICSDVGGLPELADPKAGAQIIPAGNVEVLAEALRILASETAESLAERGRLARERVQKHFSIDVCAANWAELLENIPRPRLHHDAHLAALRRGEKGLGEESSKAAGVDEAAQQIAASANRFAEEYERDEKAQERQEDLAGELKRKTTE
jgi:glycosyltransferase involved in cell wall biosynthesis